MITQEMADAARTALGGAISAMFIEQCETLPVEQLPTLSHILEDYINEVTERVANTEFIDSDLAVRIGVACRKMLKFYGDLDGPQQALMVGAIRYFIIEDDVISDSESILGFDDDAEVVNHTIQVLEVPVQSVKI